MFRNRIVMPLVRLANVADDISQNKSDITIPRTHDDPVEIRKLAIQLRKVRKASVKQKRIQDSLTETKEELSEVLRISEESDKEKEIFVRDMYRALRVPLDTIMNGAEVMRRELLGPLSRGAYKEYIDEIYDAGCQLETYTTEVLFPVEINVKETVDTSVMIQQKTAIANKQKITVDFQDNIPNLWTDKLRFRQIIISTLSHAMNYTPTDGNVSVNVFVDKKKKGSVGKYNQYLIIQIKDNGVGLDEKGRNDFDEMRKDKSELFESHAQDPDMTHLALPVIRQLVRLHHGTFIVDAVYAKGTIFTIRLPYLSSDTLEEGPLGENEVYTEMLAELESKSSGDNKEEQPAAANESTEDDNVIRFPGRTE